MESHREHELLASFPTSFHSSTGVGCGDLVNRLAKCPHKTMKVAKRHGNDFRRVGKLLSFDFVKIRSPIVFKIVKLVYLNAVDLGLVQREPTFGPRCRVPVWYQIWSLSRSAGVLVHIPTSQ